MLSCISFCGGKQKKQKTGAPDYLAYVQSAAWETKLVDAKFEYDLWWKEGW
jgi:hypothetical protein